MPSTNYDTKLSPEEEKSFQQWAGDKVSDTEDYDLRGYYKKFGDKPLKEGHLSDEFKKPNHPTFSDESIYHGQDGNEGGTWSPLGNGQYVFIPGKTNLENHDENYLNAYFQAIEPNHILLVPANVGADTGNTFEQRFPPQIAATKNPSGIPLLDSNPLNSTVNPWITKSPVLEGTEVTSNYGVRRDPFNGSLALHTGTDFRVPEGESIRSAGPGKVVKAGNDSDYGNYVEVDHGGGYVSKYGHLSSIDVKTGDTVDAGKSIGKAGTTGRSTGPHLHFEIHKDGEWTDPSEYLNKVLPQETGILGNMYKDK